MTGEHDINFHRTTGALLYLLTKTVFEKCSQLYIRYLCFQHNSLQFFRLADVRKSIEHTGTYRLTEEELAYAATTAWRNSPRCPGRIQWKNLRLFDCRYGIVTQLTYIHHCL